MSRPWLDRLLLPGIQPVSALSQEGHGGDKPVRIDVWCGPSQHRIALWPGSMNLGIRGIWREKPTRTCWPGVEKLSLPLRLLARPFLLVADSCGYRPSLAILGNAVKAAPSDVTCDSCTELAKYRTTQRRACYGSHVMYPVALDDGGRGFSQRLTMRSISRARMVPPATSRVAGIPSPSSASSK